MTTMTFRAVKCNRNILYGLVGASMLMSVFLVSQSHSKVKKAEEDSVKCQQKHDSVAAQFTVLYEHKARLEKNLHAEIERKKQVDDELKTLQSALSKEKVSQKEKYAKVLRDAEELKTRHSDEFNKLKASYDSLRSEKERLEAEVSDLNSQNSKLKESNSKLEEEIHKMQQSAPIDLNEVARLRERVKVCDAAGVPEAVESKTPVGDGGTSRVIGDVHDKIYGETVSVSEPKTTTVSADVANVQDIKNQEDRGVLPLPQEPNKAPDSSSSTSKPIEQFAEEVPADNQENNQLIPGGLRAPLEDEAKRSFLGHQFGDNIDQNNRPIFRQPAQAVPEGQEDRDYPENPDNGGQLKDDDGGADEGEEGADHKHPNEEEDLANSNANNKDLQNNVDQQEVVGEKVLPK